MVGVCIEFSGGSLGVSINIVVRGVLFLINLDLLFVIDGMFIDNMDFLNLLDIKNIQVLKDVFVGVIYGFRVVNGVVIIIINGGRGSEGVSVEFEISYGNQF